MHAINECQITPQATQAEHGEEATTQTPLESAEELTNELKRLLVKHEHTLDEEGIRREVEILERWMESYRRGLAAANKISETGTSWLTTLRDRLKLAADEIQRLEGEGGPAPSKEQMAKTEDLLKAVRRIEKVMPNLEHLFPQNEAHEDAASHHAEKV